MRSDEVPGKRGFWGGSPKFRKRVLTEGNDMENRRGVWTERKLGSVFTHRESTAHAVGK